MKISCHHIKQWLVLLLFFSSVYTPVTMASGANEIVSGLQFTAHPDGTFSVISKGVTLGALLTKISETTNVDVYIGDSEKKRPVSINVNNITLIKLLRRIAGDNYAMVFDGRHVTALHVLPPGKSQPLGKDIAVSEFSGKVKISNQRAMLFFMPADNSKSVIDNYVKRRHEALAKLSKEDPNKELHAQISFNGYLSADQVVAFVKGNRLDPVSLNIGWKENGGGYDLKQGESIEAATKSAASHHDRFIAQLQEDANMQVATLRQQGMADAEMQSELAFQKNANDLSSVFQTKGVPFYGIRVAGRAEQLNALTGNDKEIKLVDPLWGGSMEKEIGDIYPVTKIAIPLVPDNDNYLP